MIDETTADESRRAAQHESMKSRVVKDVNAGIAGRAVHSNHAEELEMDKVAGRFRKEAIGEVAEKEREVARGRVLARISQVINYVFYLLYVLLGIRLVLTLIGAQASNGFVKLIGTVTEPFYGLFRGIVGSPSAEGFTLALPLVVAIVAYALLHLGINGLLRLVAHRQTTV